MSNFCHFVLSPGLLFWVIVSPMIGQQAIGLLRSCASTVSVFWLALPYNTIEVSSKGIVKMLSVKAFSLWMKSRLFVHLPVTRTLQTTNTGYFKRLCAAFSVVRGPGTRRSTPSYAPLALSPMPMTHVSTLVLFVIHTTPWHHSPLSPCPLGSMSMTLSISLKIRQWRLSLNASYKNA